MVPGARFAIRGCGECRIDRQPLVPPLSPDVTKRTQTTMLGNILGVLFDGVAYGSLLFIIAVGLAVTMGLMNFINLAHGAFAMLGGYVSVMAMTRAGIP